MYGDFFLLEREGEPAARVERLAFGETAGRNEAWLRDTLFAHPDLLPVRDIDPSFGPLVPLCKELRTEAGPLDIACINRHGRLTLVECKLWRNPEARRKVVAQVLDYARAISRWSYSDLQRQVASAAGRVGNVPFELARAKFSDLDEHQFVDDTARAMRSGRFLLVIAGDGIREDVGALAELINRNAASGFAFGLVEVALYGLEDGALVVQPRTIARTQIVERTVVVVREPGQAQSVLVAEEADEDATAMSGSDVGADNKLGETPRQAEYRAWWNPVLDAQLDDPDQEPPRLYWPNNVRMRLPWPHTWILGFRSGSSLGVCVAGGGTVGYIEMIRALDPQREEILGELPKGAEFRKTMRDNLTYMTRRQGIEFTDEDQKQTWMATTLNTYVNVFRPRLKALMKSRRDDE